MAADPRGRGNVTAADGEPQDRADTPGCGKLGSDASPGDPLAAMPSALGGAGPAPAGPRADAPRRTDRGGGPRAWATLPLASDERLAKRAAAGDPDAFTAIFRRYGQDLYRYCVGILREPQDAQDALQNTMIRAMRALPGETRDVQLRPWLYRIAHNESVELRRRERPAEQLGPMIDVGAGTEERVERDTRLETLLADIADLPERQRASLVMRELNGLGFDEIGAALGTSPGAVRQALYEARRGLGQMAQGRDMDCEAAMRQVSDADGSPDRRGVRAHLRDCVRCRRFQAEVRERKETLAAISPMPPVLVAALAKGSLGASAGGAGAGAGVGVGSAGGALGAGTATGSAGSAGGAAVGAGAGAGSVGGAASGVGAAAGSVGTAAGAGAGGIGVAAGSVGASGLAKAAAGLLAALALGTGAAAHGGLLRLGEHDPSRAGGNPPEVRGIRAAVAERGRGPRSGGGPEVTRHAAVGGELGAGPGAQPNGMASPRVASRGGAGPRDSAAPAGAGTTAMSMSEPASQPAASSGNAGTDGVLTETEGEGAGGGKGSEIPQGSGAEDPEVRGPEAGYGNGSEYGHGNGSEYGKSHGFEKGRGNGFEKRDGNGFEGGNRKGFEGGGGRGSERGDGKAREESEGKVAEKSAIRGSEDSQGNGSERSESWGFADSRGKGTEKSDGEHPTHPEQWKKAVAAPPAPEAEAAPPTATSEPEVETATEVERGAGKAKKEAGAASEWHRGSDQWPAGVIGQAAPYVAAPPRGP